jgi:hypothetical protein
MKVPFFDIYPEKTAELGDPERAFTEEALGGDGFKVGRLQGLEI